MKITRDDESQFTLLDFTFENQLDQDIKKHIGPVPPQIEFVLYHTQLILSPLLVLIPNIQLDLQAKPIFAVAMHPMEEEEYSICSQMGSFEAETDSIESAMTSESSEKSSEEEMGAPVFSPDESEMDPIDAERDLIEGSEKSFEEAMGAPVFSPVESEMKLAESERVRMEGQRKSFKDAMDELFSSPVET